ncbi:vitamin B12-dependent ribonucleotide reductase [Spiroplasma culicicola]|uniref:Vitamin B12-dependent ribonucleotide reductase n=1 Tax=Spiroplasma culicicola AES-1 TaxID=1276246 RepID=W6AHV1_9MOLU|nr:vitamin B12-dependent ribonucleotide reductase [Spiroplasma culicicola]AHI53269.1 ribonucleotide-diphosphate reductase subunit alpha [Spiroplasma culicicola AES-1]
MQDLYNKQQINNLNEDIKKYFKHLYEIQPEDKMVFDGVSRMVMLDRYSQKDKNLVSLKVGDLVITTIKADPVFPSRGIGVVKEIKSENHYVVQVEEGYLGAIDPELLKETNSENLIIKQKYELEKPLELCFEQIAKRVGYNLAQVEKEELREEIGKEFAQELGELNIIPAGRVLYGAGSGSEVTYFNCYVMPFIKDDRAAISHHRAQVTEIMSRGGGVGTNGSTLRPKGAPAKSVGGRSSGAVSWLNDLSLLTHLIEQGGSRRGAQMIMLADWHPDVIEFIISKMQNPNILLWLRNNSQSELIRQEANNKLRFEYLTATEQKLYENVVANSDNVDSDLLKEAQEKLKHGGKWVVANSEFMTGANISVTISHRFMQAIENDEMWDLKYPDLENLTKEQKYFYDTKWADIGDVFEWEKRRYPSKVYQSIKAKDLWDLINFCATYSAEPGIFFLDAANDMTNAKGYGQKVVATNPCGEQPLAPYSVCNLAAVNLSNFVDKETKEILYSKLEKTVSVCVRMQDNVIDSTPYFLEANKQQALGERRVGLGVMGLHDLLIWAGVKYGSKEGNEIVDKIFETIAVTAYKTSIKLAKEKGSFPFLEDREKFIESGYLKKMPEDIRNGILEDGIRNSHLLTVAPTGSTGTMVGCSTGLEPYFAFSYFRSGRLGKFMEVKAKIVQDWLKYNPEYNDKPLPDYFVSAMELSPEDHADVQCIIQRWVDSSISKTVNAPKGYKVEQVEKIYTRLYKGGAKGGTVYVDGSRDTQVLSLDSNDSDLLKEEALAPIKEGDVPKKITQEQKIGNDVGDLCPMCTIGTLIDSAGCVTCSGCGAQLKCGL